MKFGPLVDAAWLHEHIADPDVRVIDFRWYIHGRLGRDEYLGGHIPGAVFVDLDDVTGGGRGGQASAAFGCALRRGNEDSRCGYRHKSCRLRRRRWRGGLATLVPARPFRP